MDARLAFIIVALAWNAACAAPRVSIDLRPEARIEGGTVLLSDIARLQSNDLDQLRRLANLPLGRAPEPGQSARVEREALRTWMARETGVRPDETTWSGADETRLHRAAGLVRGAEIGRTAVAAVQALLRRADSAGDIHVATVPRDLLVPPGRVRLETRPVRGLQLRGRVPVWVQVWAGETFIRAIPVTVVIPVLEPPSGSVTAEREAEMQLLPDGKLPQSATPPAVLRGEWAELRVGAGAVALESRVEVLQDGRIGDKVRVRKEGAASGVIARVTGRGQLELVP